jgi:hypothetical protein
MYLGRHLIIRFFQLFSIASILALSGISITNQRRGTRPPALVIYNFLIASVSLLIWFWVYYNLLFPRPQLPDWAIAVVTGLSDLFNTVLYLGGAVAMTLTHCRRRGVTDNTPGSISTNFPSQDQVVTAFLWLGTYATSDFY